MLKPIGKTVMHMIPKRNLKFLIVIQAILILSAAVSARVQGVKEVRDLFGPGHQPAQEVSPSVVLVPPPEPETLPRLIFWNRVLLDANALDHTPGLASNWDRRVRPGHLQLFTSLSLTQ